jgi:imidazoleglycerol phosphate synthase glutamine amidotransferase subunit HisH
MLFWSAAWFLCGGQTFDVPPASGVPERRLYGFQFHPEVNHTENGQKFSEIFYIMSAERRRLDWKII